jgi:hypothetical protein
MTPEKKVKQKVTKLLDSFGVYWFYPVASGYGSSGIPDLIACVRGRFVGIECKATPKDQPTALQLKNLASIKDQGGIAVVIHAENIEELHNVIDSIINDRL